MTDIDRATLFERIENDPLIAEAKARSERVSEIRQRVRKHLEFLDLLTTLGHKLWDVRVAQLAGLTSPAAIASTAQWLDNSNAYLAATDAYLASLERSIDEIDVAKFHIPPEAG